MKRARHLLLLPFFVAAPLFAQETTRIQQLEIKLDQLIRQATEIRQELDRIKGTSVQPPDDLTRVDVVQGATAPPAAASEPSASALTEVQPVNNQTVPGASKVFNPDISVIGNVFGHAGQRNDLESFGEERPPIDLHEVEVAFEAFVDPYAKAKFFIAASEEGVEVEEGYAQFITLPYDLTAKAGKMKAMFGKANLWHTHVRPWVDQPLVIHSFFGGEGLADAGISVSKVFPNEFAFVEGTAEVFSGEVENIFERESGNDLFYNTHLKLFKDLSENSNVEVGTSLARGTYAGGHNDFGGVDVTYRWKPLQRAKYNSLIGRIEAMANRRGSIDDTLKGFYASLDYQLARRWFAGLRVDAAERLFEDAVTDDRGVSATLTFWPSEFSQLRAQFRRTRYGDLRTINELLFHLQFSIGAHGAHTF